MTLFWWRKQQAKPVKWRPTHKDKLGDYYRVLHRAELHSDASPYVIYDDLFGHVLVRPAKEFDDGRFLPL